MAYRLIYCHQFYPLAIFGEMWFLTAGPVVSIPMILAEFPERKNCGNFFKKHNRHEEVQFFDIRYGFFSCLHLAVGRHHHRRTAPCPHGLHLSRVKVSLADHMHTSSGIRYKLTLSSCSFVDAAGSTHSSAGEKNVALSFSSSL